MLNKIEELENYLTNWETKNTLISQATVGWQINHVLSVINGVCLSLMRSKEEDYQPKFSLLRSYIFFLKKFPRGKAKAPKNTTNDENEITQDVLEKNIKNAKKLLAKIESLPPKSNFKHALFGVLNLKQSVKFLTIHTEHHLKIIRDILK